MKTLIVIPAYNEELTIGSVVALSKKYGDVLVVDDGSLDRTSEVAGACGAIVIQHETNKGKGQAIKTGFKYAISEGYNVVVTIDADGQHNPDEIPKLLEPIANGDADLVIGSRYISKSKKKIPFYRRVGLWVLNKGTTIASGLKVDSQSGFRAITSSALKRLKLDSNGYSIETDMVVKAKENGIKIVEVPIDVRYDVPNKHKTHPVKHGLSVLASVISLVGYKRPLLLFGFLSILSFVSAGILGYTALKPYYHGGRVYLTQAIGAGVFVIIGIQLLIAGLTLNVLGKMVREWPWNH